MALSSNASMQIKRLYYIGVIFFYRKNYLHRYDYECILNNSYEFKQIECRSVNAHETRCCSQL